MEGALDSFRSLELVQFDAENVHVLFSPETFQLFSLSETAASVVRDARNGSSLSELNSKHGLSEANLMGFVEKITTAVKTAPHVATNFKSQAADNFIGPELGKLVLMVNNYCNLKCTYCYELNTVFTKKAIDMPRYLAKTALDKFYSAFRNIREIMFIGGEPTLSEEVIEFACEYATERACNQGANPPSFGMITNGAKLTERMFEIIRKYEIQVTFSIDGPKAVQDLVRIHHDNSGSYNTVAANIRKYSSILKDKLSIEATLTRAHKEANVAVSDLLDFFAQEFGVNSAHIAAAGLPKDDPLNPYDDADHYIERELEEATARSVDNLFAEMCAHGEADGPSGGQLDFIPEMLHSLVKRQASLVMCPAGTAQLVVDAFGDLYPCWMFAGMDQFKMGNILRDEIFNSLSKKVLGRIHDNDKVRNPQCAECCARFICHACIGNNQNMTGSIESIDERFCNTVRGALKTILVKIVEARQDTERWNQIRTAVSQAREHQCRAAEC